MQQDRNISTLKTLSCSYNRKSKFPFYLGNHKEMYRTDFSLLNGYNKCMLSSWHIGNEVLTIQLLLSVNWQPANAERAHVGRAAARGHSISALQNDMLMAYREI